MKLPNKKITIQPINLGKGTINKCCGSSHPVAVAPNKKLEDLTNDLLAALWNNEDTIGIEGSIIVEEAIHLTQALKSGYGVTTGYNTPDTLAMQMMEYNLFEFSASKTEARLAASTDLLFDKEKNNIRTFAEFEKKAKETNKDFNENWLQTEYNLSVRVGQTSADYLRALETKDDFPWVEYQTIGDSNVRNAHKKLDGKFFNLNDSEAMKLWPPNGYGCRCRMLRSNRSNPPEHKKATGETAQKVMESEDAKFSTGQFNINRGNLKQVFTKKQFYSDTKGLPEKLNEMTFDKYGLEPMEELQKKSSKIKLDPTITKTNVKELFVSMANEKFMRFNDHQKRKIMMSQTTFKNHIKKTENRYQYFPLIKDILNNPSEVWMNIHPKRGFQTHYIKHYNDRSLIVVTSMNEEMTGLEIETWFEINLENKSLERRKGLKIK